MTSRQRISEDFENFSVASSISQPLLIGNDHHDDNISTSADALNIRSNFLRMSTLFAFNHGCTVSCLGLANARLGNIGVWQSGILYASYTSAGLYGASYFVKLVGSRNGLVLGMGSSASYVTSFFLASVIVDKNDGFNWLQDLVAIAGALVGGVGSSILWISQGAYFASASQLFALKQGVPAGEATAMFGGNFAFIFLVFEVMLRLLSTFLIETAGLPWSIIFGIYSLLSIIPVIFMAGVVDVEPLHNSTHSEHRGAEECEIVPLNKAAAALDLLRKEPKLKYVAPINIMFGLSMAFSLSVINGEVIQKVLSDPNSTFVGLYTAFLSVVAAGASLLFGFLESSHGCLHIGKGMVLTIGCLSYLAIAVTFLIAPNYSDFNRALLLLVYALLGVGRAAYEGTLRAFFADLFPNDKEGAYSNIILFSGTASTVGYVLSASGVLQCDVESTYCLEYSDGSLHNVLVMELMVIVAAVFAIPTLWRAIWIFSQESS